MWQGMERRRFPRADFPCKIIVRKRGTITKFTSRIVNIGVGGVCVILNQEIPRYTYLELMIFLDDKQSPIDSDARVVWTVKKDIEEDIEVDTGIEFINLKQEDRSRIDKIVKECLKKQKP